MLCKLVLQSGHGKRKCKVFKKHLAQQFVCLDGYVLSCRGRASDFHNIFKYFEVFKFII